MPKCPPVELIGGGRLREQRRPRGEVKGSGFVVLTCIFLVELPGIESGT